LSMSRTRTFQVSEIRNITDTDLVVPKNLSFFQPYLQHSIKEILEVGGEAYATRGPDGLISGVFIYDDFEKTGTVYTRSREVFDYFYELKPFSFLWSELKTEHESETYDLHTVNLDGQSIVHSFNHPIIIAEDHQLAEIEQFTALANPGTNPRWVNVALQNGDKCFLVKFQNEIAGIAWLSHFNRIGRLYSLHVKHQFRRTGIGTDLLFARLLWLKARHAHSAFSEISRNNPTSAKVSIRGHMTVTGQVYQYLGKDHGAQHRPGEPVSLPMF
jgi:ribosomal protein S18 acetylase RimI-like enzyme